MNPDLFCTGFSTNPAGVRPRSARPPHAHWIRVRERFI